MKPTLGSTPGSTAHPSLADAVVLLSRTVPGLLAIYRFGSYETDQERIDSDIDLAVLATQPVESVQRWELAQQLAGLFGRDVDLVDLSASSAVLRAQVILHGERLYCADPARCGAFEDFAYTDYARLNEERREILTDIHERGSVYGR
jgi:predicted nucleotidyltransferase